MPRRQVLPVESGLAIIELQGRFYPVRVEHKQDGTVHLDVSAHLWWETHQRLGIPFARGSQPTRGVVSFGTWAMAYSYCQRYHEECSVLSRWEQVRAETEVYPERTAWYREALREVGADCLSIDRVANMASCSTFVHSTYYAAQAGTVDEAVEMLYQQVYEHWRKPDGAAQKEIRSASSC